MKTAFVLLILTCARMYTSLPRRITVYDQKLNGTQRSGDILQQTTSSLECARRCLTSLSCRRFTYNSKVNLCTLFTDLYSLSDVGTTTFGRQCPLFQGYRMYDLSTGRRCLKHYHSRKTQADAVDECMLENAHLFTMKSQGDRNHFSDNNITGPWVDGGTSFLTWDEQSLPWNAWVPTHPIPGKCVFFIEVFSLLRSIGCTQLRPFICEIDC